MDDLVTFDYLMEDYTLPATVVPLYGWATADLVALAQQIDAELQKRHDEQQSAL
jgi:hypothetical protein